MISATAKLLGISRENSWASNMLVPTFLAVCAAGFYYLTIGSTEQAYRYISETVSPLMHPDADLSTLPVVPNDDHATFSAHRVGERTHLYVELNTPFAQSQLLQMLGSAIGSTRYGRLRGHGSTPMHFDTRMLATAMQSPEQCAKHLTTFAPTLQRTLNDKPWPLQFALRTSTHPHPTVSIALTNLAGYSPPRMFALCNNAVFVFLTTLDH